MIWNKVGQLSLKFSLEIDSVKQIMEFYYQYINSKHGEIPFLYFGFLDYVLRSVMDFSYLSNL